MKFNKITALIIALLVVGVFSADAQWDDVYFDPDKDIIVEEYNNRYSSNDDDYRRDRYNDRSSSYYNDYDFYYTSRIRRFHRPLYGFGYYDPFYIDTYYYDPFMRPGVTTLIYDDFYSRRAMAYGGFWNDPWRFSRFGFNSWNSYGFYGNSLAMRMAFGSPFGYFNSFNSFYCPPSWGNSYNYNNPANYYSDTNSRGTSFTPRRGGSSLRPDVAQRGRTIDNGRNIEPPTIDGKRPYPYTPAGANGLKPTNRNPQLNTINSRDRSRTRTSTYDPYTNPRSSRINTNSNRTRTRTNSIKPSSRTRTRTINSNNSRTRTRSITPSRSNTNRNRVSSPSRTRSSSVKRSNSSNNSRSRSSSNNNSRSRSKGNNNG